MTEVLFGVGSSYAAGKSEASGSTRRPCGLGVYLAVVAPLPLWTDRSQGGSLGQPQGAATDGERRAPPRESGCDGNTQRSAAAGFRGSVRLVRITPAPRTLTLEQCDHHPHPPRPPDASSASPR